MPYSIKSRFTKKTTDHWGPRLRLSNSYKNTFTSPEGAYTELTSVPFPPTPSVRLGGAQVCWTKVLLPETAEREEVKEKKERWRFKMTNKSSFMSDKDHQIDRADVDELDSIVEKDQPHDFNAEMEKCSLEEDRSSSALGLIHDIPRPSQDMRLSKTDSAVTGFVKTSRYNKYMGRLGKDGITTAMWGVYNQKHHISWSELGTSGNQPEPLARIFFSSSPLCHTVIQSTTASDRLDILVGLASGMIVWIDPVLSTCKEFRLDGLYMEHPVLSLHSDPSCPTRVLAVIGPTDQQDPPCDSRIFEIDLSLPEPAPDSNIVNRPWEEFFDARKKQQQQECLVDMTEGIRNNKPELELMRWMNEEWAVEGKGKRRGEKIAFNPVSVMSAGDHELNAMEYSPDGKYLALSGMNVDRFSRCRKALLSILNMPDFTIQRTFGPGHDLPNCRYLDPESVNQPRVLHHDYCFTSLAWSADSRLLAAGGKLNGVTIFCPSEKRSRVARCQGTANHDFMSTRSVAFDNEMSQAGKYRLGCVLPDHCRFMLWDFDPSLTQYKWERVAEIKPRDLPGPSKWPFDNYVLVDYSACHMVAATTPTDIYFLPDSIGILEGMGKLRLWKRPEADAEGDGIVEP
ncbi:hypothetical protein L198_05349 [Cryptococcus wingfieldii CBS 7118]|uniref:Uncharacterized protein n=1 Tax=Cryptococcus wingfieldii CBS 7118 TaxID=1295528 RepID=A0A1E3IY05_9TREE|nr:hypothetical protein L198_05349 [Cryptococcus wingfieldii CBS 7118]ODN93484.1 hypothetical protein L198_05349 [Cryptococcus wingfieldii CBS 7118]